MAIGYQDVAAVIVAGGKARRMGGQCKALLMFAGETILSRQLAVLRSRFADIAIVANDAAAFVDYDVPIIADMVPDRGPLAAVAAALVWSKRPYVFAVAGDMPYLRADVIDLLCAKGQPDDDIVTPWIGKWPEPLHAIYGRRCLPAAIERLQSGRNKTAGLMRTEGLSITQVDESSIRQIDRELRCFTNINTWSDIGSNELQGDRAEGLIADGVDSGEHK